MQTCFGRRSIPAPAGEPVVLNALLQMLEVYPRACGGTFGEPERIRYTRGLSPRLRGNRDPVLPVEIVVRSIPAPAGEPEAVGQTSVPRAVYPRACGGTGNLATLALGLLGLSPRLRGNPLPHPASSDRQRSIPAPAGEPSSSRTRSDSGKVYPRACGGTGVAQRTTCPILGLSPRLRGNPFRLRKSAILRRSIPAPAGEPSCRAR